MQNQTTRLDITLGEGLNERLESLQSNFFTTAYDPGAIQSEHNARMNRASASTESALPPLTLFDGDQMGISNGPSCKPEDCGGQHGPRPDVNPLNRPRNPFEPGSPMYWQAELATAAEPQDRVRAAAHIGDATGSMMVDVDESVKVKIDVEPVDPKNDDGRSYVTIYAYDENEKNYYVAFRGIYDEKTDTVSHQVDKDGNEVPYTSAEFEENYKGKYPLFPEKLN